MPTTYKNKVTGLVTIPNKLKMSRLAIGDVQEVSLRIQEAAFLKQDGWLDMTTSFLGELKNAQNTGDFAEASALSAMEMVWKAIDEDGHRVFPQEVIEEHGDNFINFAVAMYNKIGVDIGESTIANKLAVYRYFIGDANPNSFRWPKSISLEIDGQISTRDVNPLDATFAKLLLVKGFARRNDNSLPDELINALTDKSISTNKFENILSIWSNRGANSSDTLTETPTQKSPIPSWDSTALAGMPEPQPQSTTKTVTTPPTLPKEADEELQKSIPTDEEILAGLDRGELPKIVNPRITRGEYKFVGDTLVYAEDDSTYVPLLQILDESLSNPVALRGFEGISAILHAGGDFNAPIKRAELDTEPLVRKQGDTVSLNFGSFIQKLTAEQAEEYFRGLAEELGYTAEG